MRFLEKKPSSYFMSFCLKTVISLIADNGFIVDGEFLLKITANLCKSMTRYAGHVLWKLAWWLPSKSLFLISIRAFKLGYFFLFKLCQMLGLRQSLTPLGRHLQEFLKMEDASDHHFVLIKIFPEFLVSFTGKRIFFLLHSVLLEYQGFEKRQWFLFCIFYLQYSGSGRYSCC